MARPKKNTAPETTQATKTDTVMVALNRTTGISFPMPDGRKVLIEGNAASLRGKEKGVLPSNKFIICNSLLFFYFRYYTTDSLPLP